MHITDLNNYVIKVTDLEAAIRQAEEFKNYQHENPDFRSGDHQRQLYWADLHRKLLNLKQLKT